LDIEKRQNHFGFKHHDAENDNWLILDVHTMVANEHDSKGLAPLLEKLPREELKSGILADKGYVAYNLKRDRGIVMPNSIK
jgi:IS5 family transposase